MKLPLFDPGRSSATIRKTQRLWMRPAAFSDWGIARTKRVRPAGFAEYPVPERKAEEDKAWWERGIEGGRCWMWAFGWAESDYPDAFSAAAPRPALPVSMEAREPIGLVSAFSFQPKGSVEVGIEIFQPCWMGQGIGKEALDAWIGYLAACGWQEAIGLVHPENAASQALFAAAGFVKAGLERDTEEPDWVFVRWAKSL